MEHWYKIVTPRKEVREGRSFNPDEFAIHLEQVVKGMAQEDYQNPAQFFSRTCFTRAFKDHVAMILKRLSGKTENTAPVLTLVTQFGGGKTHTLTALYHLVKSGKKSADYPGVSNLIQEAGIREVPHAKCAVFVGNAWDPYEGYENPWIDIARQIAGNKGVELLGTAAKTTPPGTEALLKIFQAAESPVLILMDEVLNFFNRHRSLAESCYAFFDNLFRAMTATTCGALLISLPRSQIEMTEWDYTWQDRITKVARRVAKDLIVNDESEISEVVRKRLFEDLGDEKIRKKVAKAYSDWCFERRAQLPIEWTAVDTAVTETKAKDFLRGRFETCYPFHPATISVFQRKWQALPQYQQTRGTLAMLAKWISWAYTDSFQKARREPLITIGSAPLEVREFLGVILGQLGESRLESAIESDISGTNSHAQALDADTKGALKDIHRRVGTAILFESSGGQIDKVTHLPELRFALGEPEIDTTSIDNAVFALEAKSFFIRRVGSDGFKIHHKPTLKKVVSDRRASLDDDREIKPAMLQLIRKEFERGAGVPLVLFPSDAGNIPDSPRLTFVIVEPETEWTESESIRNQISEWTKQRGNSPRLYPGSIVWCLKKPGQELKEKIEVWLSWKRVQREVSDGTLGGDFSSGDLSEIHAQVSDAEESAKDEVWGGYRYIILADSKETWGLKIIDLGAGHSSSSGTMCGRIISAMKSQALLNESVGASYIERNWPPALKEISAWPLSGLRQSFLNGSLTRLLDPDTVLKNKIIEFVDKGEFGLASGQKLDGTYERVWLKEKLPVEEVLFDTDIFLLKKEKALALKEGKKPEEEKHEVDEGTAKPEPTPTPTPEPTTEEETKKQSCAIHIFGTVPPELWNRFGTNILPKIRTGTELKVGVDFKVTINAEYAQSKKSELKQALQDLGLQDKVKVEEETIQKRK